MATKFRIFRNLQRRFTKSNAQPGPFQGVHASLTGRLSACRTLLESLLTGFQSPAFIPSVLGAHESFIVDRDQLRTRRMEATLLSVLVHVSVILLAILLVQKSNGSIPAMEDMVVINMPFFDMPGEGEGKGGTGGGGGGRHEQAPPAWGGMPAAARVQLLTPDPAEPQPLIPQDEDMAVVPSVVMPVEMSQLQNLPVGDFSAPFSVSRSPGPGHGDGIGDGDGPGIGDGRGPGYGKGNNGGYGGDGDGTLGRNGNGIVRPGVAGLKHPEVLFDPRPEYTEEARKSRVEGVVQIQAVIRKNGTVDSFRILRGLGYGLDESAIRTIGAKWRFRPGQLNGVPVDVLANIEISFRLY